MKYAKCYAKTCNWQTLLSKIYIRHGQCNNLTDNHSSVCLQYHYWSYLTRTRYQPERTTAECGEKCCMLLQRFKSFIQNKMQRPIHYHIIWLIATVSHRTSRTCRIPIPRGVHTGMIAQIFVRHTIYTKTETISGGYGVGQDGFAMRGQMHILSFLQANQ